MRRESSRSGGAGWNLNTRVSPSLNQKLQEEARRRGLTKSELSRLLLTAGLQQLRQRMAEKNEKKDASISVLVSPGEKRELKKLADERETSMIELWREILLLGLASLTFQFPRRDCTG